MAASSFASKQYNGEEFVESCGAILFNFQHQTPRSRADAALREMREETGYRCRLYPVTMPTRAPSAAEAGDVPDKARTYPDLTEPFMLSTWEVGGKSQVKLIWWYIAEHHALHSNSCGIFGDMRISEHEWRSVFVKMSPHKLQELMSFEGATGRLFYGLFRGRLLNQVRLDACLNRGNLSGTNQARLIDCFLDVELRWAEHVADAYRQTMQKSPDPREAPSQKIHRFFYNRLKADKRFLDFYGKEIPSLSNGIMDSASQLLNATLVINGVSHPPLRHYLDRAQELLNPHLAGSQATLASLPIAIGLGDGHGGNVMVVEGKSPAAFIHIDYEVSGSHTPILDMAKPLWLDGFFNVAYADLLESSITDQRTKSGTSVSWILDEDSIYLDYDVACEEIGRLTMVTKLEYILRSLLQYMKQNAPQKTQLALDVLGSALLACALLTRDFSARPDVFFLSLALGVDLAHDVNRVLSRVFDWDMGLSLAADELLSLISSRENGTDGNELIFDLSQFTLHDLITLISSSGLEQEEIAPHTCIRELIFAEPRVDHHFAYRGIMKKRKADDLLVDAGCCFFDLGRMLYDEGQTGPKPTFRHADLVDREFPQRHPDLRHRFDLVHSANVIHLFDVEDQDAFFRNLVFLAKPGDTIFGRQVGLAADHPASYRQPEGKGYRFTALEFRDWCLRIGGWDAEGVDGPVFEAQVVQYDEIRLKRADTGWVLQWRVRVPKTGHGYE
ncbi:hypothetical protein ESCO_004370 [Escovopsis weberi]|uniref:Nudix hydrolase domain-containing protein n=1 Tax=Escovopsis weberi TaxID=150374 RepID=A0A0M8MXJ4_ESCWE|nr:hypothetical protein ESCO_004370 [Escovopsis weberi]